MTTRNAAHVALILICTVLVASFAAGSVYLIFTDSTAGYVVLGLFMATLVAIIGVDHLYRVATRGGRP